MKNRVKKSMALLLAVIMLVVGLPMTNIAFDVSAEDGEYTEGYYTYTVENGEATIKECDRSISGDIVIPDTLGGYPVTSIGSSAFEDCTGLTSITIPDSVTSIGNGAFAGCTGLTSVTIPDSVTSIGGDAFYNTVWYNSQPDGIIYAGKVLYEYKGTMPKNTSIVILEGIKGIANNAFYDCTGLTRIAIPNSVTSIGSDAFSGCTELTNITIPDSVTSIGNYAFLGCTSLESVTIPNSVTSIGSDAFSGCTELTNITIPDSVTSIGDHAFYKCISLTSVTIPDNVTDICWGAFRECTELESLTIGSGVVNIEYFAFHDCKKLTSLVIPDSVKSISGEAFEDCVALKEITIGKNLENVGYRAFSGCTELTKINWNAENANDFIIDKFGGECKAFSNAGNAEKGIEVVFGDNVKRIPAYAFFGCDNLRSATIPESVTEIGDRALGYDDNYVKVENFTIYGYYNTAAHTYAKTNGFKFVALDENHTHTFGEWTVTTPATCTSDGKETRTCSICEESETRTIAKTGHNDSNNDGKCDRCGAAIEGYTPSSNCNHICHKKGIARFFYLIARFFWKIFKTNKYCSCNVAHY